MNLKEGVFLVNGTVIILYRVLMVVIRRVSVFLQFISSTNCLSLFIFFLKKNTKSLILALFLLFCLRKSAKRWADPLAQSLCLHQGSYVRLSYSSLWLVSTGNAHSFIFERSLVSIITSAVCDANVNDPT